MKVRNITYSFSAIALRPWRRAPLVALLLMWAAAAAWADGRLTHMSGPISVQRADGTALPATVGTTVGEGDTVVTGPGAYVRMEMSDGSEMVLRPESRLKVETYQFAAAKPAADSFIFSVLKGGLRTVTGLIGKRGNRDAYELRTATATVGIRGTQFDLRVCQANCGALADGTYLAVRFGAVQTTNAQGSLAVAAGQVAHVPPLRAPLMLPRDPGIGFTPPPVIPKLDEKKKLQSAPAASPSPEGAAPAAKAAAAAPEQKAEAKAQGQKASRTGTPAAAAEAAGARPAGETPAGETPAAAPAAGASQGPAPPASAAPAAGNGQNCAVE